MSVRTKPDIDRLVASDTGLSIKKVRAITSSFLSRVMASLADQDDVHLDGFGRLHLTAGKGHDNATKLANGYPNLRKAGAPAQLFMKINRHFRVSFSKSEPFKRILREKYGPNTKEA
jgi:hypothetical protein